MWTSTKPERITPVSAMMIFRPIEEESILWRRVRCAGLCPAAGLVATALMGISCFCSKERLSSARTDRAFRQPAASGERSLRSTSSNLVLVGPGVHVGKRTRSRVKRLTSRGSLASTRLRSRSESYCFSRHSRRIASGPAASSLGHQTLRAITHQGASRDGFDPVRLSKPLPGRAVSAPAGA